MGNGNINTARARNKALEYEQQLNWGEAADWWDVALALYPVAIGELQSVDREHMARRRDSCRRQQAIVAAELLRFKITL